MKKGSWLAGLFTKTQPKFTPKDYVIFNVSVFNAWWNDKDNGATYANPGIFLRTDKLSRAHIEEYLVKCHGLELNEKDYSLEIIKFNTRILNDWHRRLRKKSSAKKPPVKTVKTEVTKKKK